MFLWIPQFPGAHYGPGFFTPDPGSNLGRANDFCPLFLSVPPTKLPLRLLISVKEGRKESNPDEPQLANFVAEPMHYSCVCDREW